MREAKKQQNKRHALVLKRGADHRTMSRPAQRKEKQADDYRKERKKSFQEKEETSCVWNA